MPFPALGKRRIVLFDAAGTLFHIRGSVGEIYAQYLAKYGARASPWKIERIFREVWENASPLAFPGLPEKQRRLQEKAWWEHVTHKVFRSLKLDMDWSAPFAELYKVFSGERGWVLYPEVKEVLTQL